MCIRDSDESFRLLLERSDVRAIGAMDRNPSPDGHETHDRVTRDGRTAPRQAHQHVIETFDDHAAHRSSSTTIRGNEKIENTSRFLILLPLQPSCETIHHRPGTHAAFADRSVQVVEITETEFLSNDDQVGVVTTDRHRMPTELLRQILLAVPEGRLSPLLGEPLSDLCRRP